MNVNPETDENLMDLNLEAGENLMDPDNNEGWGWAELLTSPGYTLVPFFSICTLSAYWHNVTN